MSKLKHIEKDLSKNMHIYKLNGKTVSRKRVSWTFQRGVFSCISLHTHTYNMSTSKFNMNPICIYINYFSFVISIHFRRKGSDTCFWRMINAPERRQVHLYLIFSYK